MDGPRAAGNSLGLPPLPPRAPLTWRSDGPGHIEITRKTKPFRRILFRGSMLIVVWLFVVGAMAWILVPTKDVRAIAVAVFVAIAWLLGAIAWLAKLRDARNPPRCGVKND